MGLETMGLDVVGDELEGDVLGDEEIVGVARRGPLLRLRPRPGWHRGRLTGGIYSPREGLEPLPLVPDVNQGVLTSVFPLINFIGRPQRPFKGERLLVRVLRSAGATGVSAQSVGIFVGTTVIQAALGQMDIEDFSATAFGVRLSAIPADPGIEIRIPVTAVPAVPVGETVTVIIKWIGKTVQA